MTARSRSTARNIVNGTWRSVGQTSGGWLFTKEQSSCTDHTGQGDCDPFLVESWVHSGAVMHDQYDVGYWGSYFQNYTTDGSTASNFPHMSVSGVLSDGDCAIQGANRSSPSSAYVDIPANILQLGELTQLLRTTGMDLIRKGQKVRGGAKLAAEGYLEQQFGVIPYVSDALKLLKFNDQVDRRLKVFDKLRSARGYRRTMEIGAWKADTVFDHVFQSQGAYSALPVTGSTIVGKKVHCRWSPDVIPIPSDNFHKRRLAQRSLLGVQQNIIDAATLWEAIPWSWLIDWCYDVGGYLRTYRNTVPAILTTCVVMEHTLTTYSAPGYNWPQWYQRSQTPFLFTREKKVRRPSPVYPSAHFPFLTGNQMGIVASLAIAKAR